MFFLYLLANLYHALRVLKKIRNQGYPRVEAAKIPTLQDGKNYGHFEE